jgi:hypothetical protein
MYDQDKSAFIAVNGKRVRSSGHCRVVSREMLVMHSVHTLGKLRGCSKEASWDKTSQGVCEHACQGSEATSGRLGSNRGLEERLEGSRKAQGDRTGSAEHVCDTCKIGPHK